MIKQYFGGSMVFTAVALILSVAIGEYYGGNAMALTYFISALMLGVLEVSVSLDNAVVNATVLKDMDNVWRQRFLTWGMAIAVFGMRLIFPLAIVSVAGSVNPFEAVRIALLEPKHYEEILTSVHMQVMAFGGTFLFLVFASHFINHEKEEHWIPGIGHFLAKIGKHSTIKLALPILVIAVFSQFVGQPKEFLISAMYGLIVYLLVDGIGDLFDVEDAAVGVARAGIASFIYLEVLDASFSFDGVIAAFAITNNFLIIMLGLSIGAMFVRSLTIMLVEKDTLDTMRYLEDGAFWGIGWLVVTMFLSVVHVELGEVVVAGGAAALIAIAAWHSMIANKRDSQNGDGEGGEKTKVTVEEAA
jgi:hypothetical protein